MLTRAPVRRAPQNGDSAAEELSVAAQLKAKLLPITKAAPKIESVKVTPEMQARNARAQQRRGVLAALAARALSASPHGPSPAQAVRSYAALRLERMNARMVGIRAKKAAEAEKEKEAAAK